MKMNLVCLSCYRDKQSHYCDACDSETYTRDIVTQPDKQFIEGLWHESDPFRYRIKIQKEVYGIEAYGEDDDGVFLRLFKNEKIIEYRPSS